jgi:hypothetical protein
MFKGKSKAEKEAMKKAEAEKKAALKAEKEAQKKAEAERKAREAEEAALKAKAEKEAEEAARKAEAEKKSLEAAQKAEEARKSKEAEKAAKAEAKRAAKAEIPPANAHLLIVIFGNPKSPQGKFIANRKTGRMFHFGGDNVLEASSRGAIETLVVEPTSPWNWAYNAKLVIHTKVPGKGDL